MDGQKPEYTTNGNTYGETNEMCETLFCYTIQSHIKQVIKQIITKTNLYTVPWQQCLTAICIPNTFMLVYAVYARYEYLYWQCA